MKRCAFEHTCVCVVLRTRKVCCSNTPNLRVFTRQEALEINSAENATKLVQAIESAQASLHFHKQKTMEPQNAREWGLFHEESARNAYKRVAIHTHHKLELIAKGFLISKSKAFLGASVDNIQKCQCSKGWPNTVVEYK